MKTKYWLIFISLVLAIGLGASGGIAQEAGPTSPEAALGSAFTYQGYLTEGQDPADGNFDFRFRLYDSLEAGGQVGSDMALNDVPVSEGLFTVQLDFGVAAFAGQACWLEVAVRPGGSKDDYTTLSPRQPLTATPYALYAKKVGEHDHLGETWTGIDQTLVISGSFGTYPYRAPLALYHPKGKGINIQEAGQEGVFVHDAGMSGVFVKSAGYEGVRVYSAGYDGVRVDSAGEDGVQVESAGKFGVRVESAGLKGVSVYSVGNPSTTNSSSAKSGFAVGGVEGSGLYVGRADVHGVVVQSAGYDGVRVQSAGDDGVEVVTAGDDGVAVFEAGGDGVAVFEAGDDGVDVDSAGQDGVYVGTVGNNGVSVYSAGRNGVYANTAQISGEWGFNTPDKIHASNVTASSLSLLAQVADSATLSPGDLVAAVGVAEPAPGSTVPQPLVAPASQEGFDGLIGVVESCMAFADDPQPAEQDGESAPVLRSVDGPCQPGSYVTLTVYGVAYVQVDPAFDIQPGMRLTASATAGAARPLRTETLNGMSVTEGAPVIGIALAAPEAGSQTVPVMVTLR